MFLALAHTHVARHVFGMGGVGGGGGMLTYVALAHISVLRN